MQEIQGKTRTVRELLSGAKYGIDGGRQSVTSLTLVRRSLCSQKKDRDDAEPVAQLCNLIRHANVIGARD